MFNNKKNCFLIFLRTKTFFNCFFYCFHMVVFKNSFYEYEKWFKIKH